MERVKKPISHWFHGSCAPKRHWHVNSSLGRLQFITYTFWKLVHALHPVAQKFSPVWPVKHFLMVRLTDDGSYWFTGDTRTNFDRHSHTSPAEDQEQHYCLQKPRIRTPRAQTRLVSSVVAPYLVAGHILSPATIYVDVHGTDRHRRQSMQTFTAHIAGSHQSKRLHLRWRRGWWWWYHDDHHYIHRNRLDSIFVQRESFVQLLSEIYGYLFEHV